MTNKELKHEIITKLFNDFDYEEKAKTDENWTKFMSAYKKAEKVLTLTEADDLFFGIYIYCDLLLEFLASEPRVKIVIE